MQVRIVGYTQYGCPVFLVRTERFSAHEFARHSYSEAPVLIIQYEDDDASAYVYGFTLIRHSKDMHREWDNGRMEPFACLSRADCEALTQIAGSTAEQSVKNRQVQEILKNGTFLHFGSGS